MKILALVVWSFSFVLYAAESVQPSENTGNVENQGNDSASVESVELVDLDILEADDLQCSLVGVPDYFLTGKSSPLACIVGMNEGTRTKKCKFTKHYYGHEEFSNGEWNTGSFSNNGRGLPPDEADEHWLSEMSNHYSIYVEGVTAAGFDPDNALIFLTFMDLFTQSPQAAQGWNDEKSAGLGFLGLLKTIQGQPITMKKLAELRLNAFYNTQGEWEGELSEGRTKRMVKRRSSILNKVVKKKLAGIQCK